MYDALFTTEDPEQGGDFLTNLNPNSLEVRSGCLVEPSVTNTGFGARFQFMRHGYFSVDLDTTPELLVFNRIVSLKDTWGKVAAQTK